MREHVGLLVRNLRVQRRFCRAVAGASSFLMLATHAVPAFAAGTSVLGGDAMLTGAARATLDAGSATDSYAQFVANVGAKSAVLDWSKFNVGAGKEMNFSGAGTTFFNLVDGAASKSQIDGLISGNGSVWVINPNGIAFGANAQVNVGGLFAAAAGNLSNADQLRDGTATLPTFSSFAGEVTTAAGSKFTADQVALLGKTVSAAGDFKGVTDLTIGAAGKLTVDEVAGGRVSVSAVDFADDASAFSVELGDLDLGDTASGYSGGDLTVRAGNSVKVSGDVTVGNAAYLTTRNGHVEISKDSKLESVGLGGYVNVVTGMSDGGKGDIRVAGDVKANGYWGSTTLYAGYGVAGVGGAAGDVSVSGTVSADAAAEIGSLQGGVSIAEGGEVKVTDGSVKLLAAKDVSVNGRVANATSYGQKVSVQSNGGSVSVGQSGSIVSEGNLGTIQLVAGVNEGATGNVKVDGSVRAAGGNGAVWLASGYGEDAKGSVSVDGTVQAGSALAIDGKDGINGAGTLDATGAQMQLTAANGDISVTGKALAKETFLEAKNAVTMNNADNDFETLNKVAGTSVSVHDATGLELGDVTATQGGVQVVSKSGDVVVGGTVSAMDAENGFAFITSAQQNGSKGNIIVNGTVKSGRETFLGAGYDSNGGLTGGKGGVTVNQGALVLGENGSTYVWAAGGDGKGVDIGGEVRAYQVGIGSRDASGVVARDGAKITAGWLDASGSMLFPGTLSVIAAAGDIDLTKTTVSSGNAAFSATGSLSLDAASELTATGDVTIFSGGTKTSALNGALTVGSVDITARGDVELGNITANSYNLDSGDMTGDGVADPSSIGVTTLAGDISVRDGAKLTATDPNGAIYLNAARSISTGAKSTVSATGANGLISVIGNGGSGAQVEINGVLESANEVLVAGVGGDVKIGAQGVVRGEKTALVESYGGKTTVDGLVQAEEAVVGSTGTGIDVGGLVQGQKTVLVQADHGNVHVSGQVIADGEDGAAFLFSGGDVRFSSQGEVRATESVGVIAKGNVTQENTGLPYRAGQMDAVSLKPAASAREVLLEVGGSVGEGPSSPFVVDGKTYAIAFGDMSLAAGYGHSLEGGNASSVQSARSSAEYNIASTRKMLEGTLSIEESMARMANPSDFDDNAFLYADGDVYLYTAGSMDANSYIGSGGDMTVSAAKFGDMSYFDVGGRLTLNNVGKTSHPQIGYFESVNGKEPSINNQPNDMVIFVNGRLAGGNLKILNQFGANEAFMVSTPELKSAQGIFGNPIFLHSDLDVANPLEIGTIDYMLQETPRLTLDKEFPKEVDSHVDSVVVPEKDSIQFGRGAKDAAPAKETADQGK